MKERRVIYVESCSLCPLYDADGQECSKLHRDVKPWDGIDEECPLPLPVENLAAMLRCFP